MTLPIPTIEPRFYQLPAFEYWDNLDGKPGRAVEIWSRRTGKDLTYMNIQCMLSFERKGLYLHMLPEFAHARRTIWEGFTNEGERLIDNAFPPELRESTNEQNMRIVLKNGAVWQLGGSDNFDRYVGGNPIFLCFSEYALSHPQAWEIMRPILKLNGGHAAFITTPRGYNHAHEILKIAQREPGWRASVIDGIQAKVMTQADIDEEIRLGMPEELARQEYLCDFSAANVGSILGRYLEAAEAEGRVVTDGRSLYDPAGAVFVSSDIGYSDAATFWFWQKRHGGRFALIDYDEDTGLDAEQWIPRIGDKGYKIEQFWLPHDAVPKTFQSRHSVFEQFATSGLAKTYKVAGALNATDKVNAARSMLARCEFDGVKCAQGLLGLREWSFEYDERRRMFRPVPYHNWASHPADGFAYGAANLRDFVPKPRARVIPDGTVAAENFHLKQLWRDHETAARSRRRLQ